MIAIQGLPSLRRPSVAPHTNLAGNYLQGQVSCRPLGSFLSHPRVCLINQRKLTLQSSSSDSNAFLDDEISARVPLSPDPNLINAGEDFCSLFSPVPISRCVEACETRIIVQTYLELSNLTPYFTNHLVQLQSKLGIFQTVPSIVSALGNSQTSHPPRKRNAAGTQQTSRHSGSHSSFQSLAGCSQLP